MGAYSGEYGSSKIQLDVYWAGEHVLHCRLVLELGLPKEHSKQTMVTGEYTGIFMYSKPLLIWEVEWVVRVQHRVLLLCMPACGG